MQVLYFPSPYFSCHLLCLVIFSRFVLVFSLCIIVCLEEEEEVEVEALPMSDLGFSLSKADFRDAIHLRYGWIPQRMPSQCVCSESFTVDRALTCSHGGYLGM